MKVCTSREVIAVDIGEKGTSSMKQLFIGLLEVGNNQDSWLKEYLIAHGNKKKIIQFKLDTGAQANILPISIAKALSNEISSSQPKLVSYGSNCIRNYGVTTLSLVNDQNCQKIPFELVDEGRCHVLGLASCVKLNVMRRIDR